MNERLSHTFTQAKEAAIMTSQGLLLFGSVAMVPYYAATHASFEGTSDAKVIATPIPHALSYRELNAFLSTHHLNDRAEWCESTVVDERLTEVCEDVIPRSIAEARYMEERSRLEKARLTASRATPTYGPSPVTPTPTATPAGLLVYTQATAVPASVPYSVHNSQRTESKYQVIATPTRAALFAPSKQNIEIDGSGVPAPRPVTSQIKP
jgi:hypothetical protein